GVESMNSKFRKQARKVVGKEVHFSIQKLREYPFRQIFLLEELTVYGFPASIVLDVERALNSQSGKVFYANNYQLVRNREELIVSQLELSKTPAVKVPEGTTSINEPLKLVFKLRAIDGNFQVPKNHSTAALDYNKLSFPLTIRPWHEGDWFIPFGMDGRKKISDFIIDQKIPLHHKKQVFVLESNGDIVWVIGYRIDNRYCIDNSTTKTLVISKTK
ncbi:MAG: tRNA lysidine(34) synthetase TilS, partial [Perlabentimonas sp.]